MFQISLRDVIREDLPVFYENQSDPRSYQMAGLKPRDHDAFNQHWDAILSDPETIIKTIIADGEIAGNILTFIRDNRRETGYWLGVEFWGKGIASESLRQFLEIVKIRPLYAYAIKSNAASKRVLEKCGFKQFGEDEEGCEFELRGRT